MERDIITNIYIYIYDTSTDNVTSSLPVKFGRPIVEGRSSKLIKHCYYYYWLVVALALALALDHHQQQQRSKKNQDFLR